METGLFTEWMKIPTSYRSRGTDDAYAGGRHCRWAKRIRHNTSATVIEAFVSEPILEARSAQIKGQTINHGR